MQIQSVFNANLQGIQKASQGITETSSDIAQSLSKDKANATDNTENLVNLIEDKNVAAANIKALETTNEVLGSLINIKV
jgi:hypothetical protein